MAAPTTVSVTTNIPMNINKVKIKKGQKISKGSVFCMFTSGSDVIQKFKSSVEGIVHDVRVQDGQEVEKGSVLFDVQECNHPTVMKDMCADCGADLRVEYSTAGDRKEEVSASVAMVHSIPELIVSEELAKELGKADEERLLKTRKLVLLVDLDQTLIHTTNDNIPPNLKDVHHYQLWHGNQLWWYHTRIRPRTQEFLDNISKLYELHICTFGVRMYAHTIAKVLDPEGKYFSIRILSRDECFSPQSKTANLKALFPCGDSMVCIIDDREDVWHFSPNLVHVKPYRFFQGTADINAPPGLTKTELNDQPLIHRVRRVSQSSTGSTDSIDGRKDDVGKKSSDKNEQNILLDTKNDNAVASIKIQDTISEMETTDKLEVKIEIKESCQLDPKPQSEEQIKVNAEGENQEIDSSKDIVDLNSVEIEASNDDMNLKNSDGRKSSAPNDVKDKETYNSGLETEVKALENKTKGQHDALQDKSDNEIVVGDTELIEWDDDDDYLYHLEDILKTIHKVFYDMYDQLKVKESDKEIEKPNLKNIIPYIKKKVLKGCNILFSGVIPTNMNPEKSRAYIVARSLGANIHPYFKEKHCEKDPSNFTTHVVAAKLGTNKVLTAMKYKDMKIVSIDWLWSCSERWEHVEEILFPLTVIDDQNRDSPDITTMLQQDLKRKCDSNEICERKKRQKQSDVVDDEDKDDVLVIDEVDAEEGSSSADMSRSEGNLKAAGGDAVSANTDTFAMSYNPIFAFSDDDLAYMDKEVEDEIGDEEGSSSEEDNSRDARIRHQVLKSTEVTEDSSSEDSMCGDRPRGWGLKGNVSPKSSDDDVRSQSEKEELGPEYESETDQDRYEKILDAFGPETENSDGEYQESVGSVDDEIADAVMKEFLS